MSATDATEKAVAALKLLPGWVDEMSAEIDRLGDRLEELEAELDDIRSGAPDNEVRLIVDWLKQLDIDSGRATTVQPTLAQLVERLQRNEHRRLR